MLFSSRPTHIAYLRRGELSLYDRKAKLGRVELPLEAVQYMEVLDAKKLSELIRQIATLINGQRVLLALDGSLVFQTAMEASKAGELEAARRHFEDIVPLDPAQRAVLVLPSKAQYFFFATNTVLYRTVRQEFEAAGNKVVAIVPTAVYGLDESATLSAAAREKLLAENKVAQGATFPG